MRCARGERSDGCCAGGIVGAAKKVHHTRGALRAKYGSRIEVTALDPGIVDPAEHARAILRIVASKIDR
jgi:hypothetical protein